MFPVGDFCRLCLTFEGEFGNMCIDDTKEKITACIPDLTFEDHLPNFICKKCSEQLDSHFEFRNRCLVSQFLLTNFVEEFLADSKTSNNTKLQVRNILKNVAPTNKSLDNVNEPTQEKLKVFLENIRNFVDASLELNKNSCTVQDFEEFCDKSKLVSCELQDFEDSLNTNNSDYVSNVSDCDATSSIFSDDDDSFVEEDDESNAQSKSSIDIITERESDKPISAKLESSISKAFNKESKMDKDLDPRVLIDIGERVKLRKRQVQIGTKTINCSGCSSKNVYKTKKREAAKSTKPYKHIQANKSRNTKYTRFNYKPQHLHNKPKTAASESTIPAVNKQANNGSINQLICGKVIYLLPRYMGTVSDNLGRKLDQISRNEGITTATDFEKDTLNNAKKHLKTLQCESHKLEEERIRLLGQKAKFTAILQSLKDNVDTNVSD